MTSLVYIPQLLIILKILISANPLPPGSYKIHISTHHLPELDSELSNGTESIVSELRPIHELLKSREDEAKVYETCDEAPWDKSGVYNIRVSPQERKRVYCDQEYEGGGWAVIQWRFDGSVNFYRGWAEYRHGFGNIDGGEFWLGLDIIHQLTYSGPHELLIILEDFEGNTTIARYDRFEIAAENEMYKATLADGFSGSAGDSISYIKGRRFTTFDKDNDSLNNKNCAVINHGAWWYDRCHYSNLNGKYLTGIKKEGSAAMVWQSFRGMYSLKQSKMMIRRRQ
ncbi:ficolin-1-like [Armigeres subalbatus]|uniref:ficolin-1-like n=1 Tax=Armigeres subalbatus TaxID=124917 RepID=UPI002ED63097